MAASPDVDGNFDVPNLPEAPAGGSWTITARTETPEPPALWSDYYIEQFPWMLTLNTNEGTWQQPMTSLTDADICNAAGGPLSARFTELRGEWITANGAAHPVPLAE